MASGSFGMKMICEVTTPDVRAFGALQVSFRLLDSDLSFAPTRTGYESSHELLMQGSQILRRPPSMKRTLRRAVIAAFACGVAVGAMFQILS